MGNISSQIFSVISKQTFSFKAATFPWDGYLRRPNFSRLASFSAIFSPKISFNEQYQPVRHKGTGGCVHLGPYDFAIVGGGIVGAATARELLNRHPKMKMCIVEKEPRLAVHQTGHNSGVIHAGIYYTPGSLKAKLCGEGLHLMYKYCDEKKIPYKKVGKVIVATNDVEVERLMQLEKRGIANKVPGMKLLDAKELKEVEPNCNGVKALHSPETGILDYTVVCQSYGEDFKKGGGEIHFNFEVNEFKDSKNSEYPVMLGSKQGLRVMAKYVLTCAGLYSDKIAMLSGCSENPKIVPFRGEYLRLTASKAHLVKGNIYPVPDPRFPFLGVHFTPRINGEMWLGPNAVLAFKREGYSWFDISPSELWDAVTYKGFIKMGFKYLVPGIRETIKSAVVALQVKDLRKFISDLSASDVERGNTGVRAQAMDADGNLVDDFVFDMGTTDLSNRILHCRNAPSPGATSSLAIAKMMADKIESQFGLKKG